MNASQRKVIRDAHYRRLAGVAVMHGRSPAILQRIDGANSAVICYLPRRGVATSPVEFTVKADTLRPAKQA